MLRNAAPLLAATLVATGAMAQTPAPTSAPPASGAAAPAVPAPAAPASAMSESKFLSQLYSEIARHTPAKSPAGPGEVRANFHVTAQGKIDRVAIVNSTSPALAAAVRKILAQVQAPPPPPNADSDIGQTFRFH